MEERDKHSGSICVPKAGVDVTFPGQLCSPKAPTKGRRGRGKGTDPAALGVCCPVPHTWAGWGPEVQCPFPKRVPGLCLPLSGSSATAHAERPFPWRGKAPPSPAPALAWVTCSWPGEGKDKCHLGYSRRSGRAGDGKIPSDSQIPPWTSAVVSFCHVPSENVPSAPPATSTTKPRLHSAPPNPWHLPSHDGADQGGESSQSRGGLGPHTRLQNPNSVDRPMGLEVSTMKQLRALCRQPGAHKGWMFHFQVPFAGPCQEPTSLFTSQSRVSSFHCSS